jgi:thiol-disulfide isomerase/thioredoxin
LAYLVRGACASRCGVPIERLMRSILLLALSLALTSCGQPEAANNQAEVAADVPGKGVDRSHAGQPGPAISFKNPDGGDISLASFHGTPVLVNLWATWCAPCVKELPTLDALAKAQRGDGALGVIAVSQDMGPHGSVEAVLQKLGTKDLGAYHDPKMALSGALNAQILPTTILFDGEGREVWRYTGDLDWTGPEAAKLLAEGAASARQ